MSKNNITRALLAVTFLTVAGTASLSAAVESSPVTGTAASANPAPAAPATATPVSASSPATAAAAPLAAPSAASATTAPVPLSGTAAAPIAGNEDTIKEPETSVTVYPGVTLEIPDTALVRKYRTQYTSPDGIKYLSAVMKRSVLFRDHIRAETDRLEVPSCLFYLPVIESGFSATAVSRSGATGVWQFMRNSISGYGIRVNEWMDERRDPWITTTAALRKLKDNYNYLGDWYLALAAYNCGLGATRNAIKKGGTNDYWKLCEKGYFKTETVHYVPKFLAIAEILSRSDEYGIDWGDASAIPEFSTLTVKRAVDLDLLAMETSIDKTVLRSANPALFYHITPPDSSYTLRLPAGSVEPVASLLADKSRMLLEYYMYKIKSGDTLYALALHYGISVDMILQYNPGLKPSTLKIGKNIVIPALKEVSAYAGHKDPANLDFTGSYLVKQGDTLWSIALAHNIQVETLADKNNLDVNAVLKLGKSLRVPIL